MIPRVARLLFALAVSVNLAVLYAPDAPSGAGSIPYLDKAVHFGVFALVAWTGRCAGIPLGWLAAGLAAHAFGSELVQHFLLPNRAGDPWDVLADCAGILAGLLLPRPRRSRAPAGARAKMST